MEELAKSIGDQIAKQLVEQSYAYLHETLAKQLAQINVTELVNSIVQNRLESIIKIHSFPERSIAYQSINFDGMLMTGDHITGGIISNFGSTGIEDRATHIQMTLMDHATAFEGPLWAPELKITGNVTVDGTLIVNGKVDANTPMFTALVDKTSDAVKVKLNSELFTSFSDIIFNKIREQGLDLDRITQGGKEIVNGNQLGYHVVDTNIKRLGVVNDLRTSGENLLSDTLYVTKKRVGVNTIDPSAALSIWDEEVEIAISKREHDTGHVNTPRNQKLILGANNKENIKLHIDGSVQIDSLNLNGVRMTASQGLPNYPSSKGQVVWNSNPGHGSPIGWVCLGATQWAGFGKIE